MGDVYVKRRAGYRSLFWPLLLIGIGAVWLLVNTGVFEAEHIAVLARLWPLLLIAAGLDLLFGRTSRSLGAIIGIGAVAGMLLLMLIGPSLGLVNTPELQSAHYEETVGEANSARIILDSGVNTVTVSDLPESEAADLFTADIDYFGEVNFDVSGGAARTIKLEQDDDSISNGFAPFLLSVFGGDEQRDEAATDWTISLSRFVPLNLDVNAGVGKTNLDLSDLQLTGLDVNAGVGAVDVMLPNTGASYNVALAGGVGDMTITLPEGVAVQLDADIGVGSLNLSSALRRVSGDDDNFVGDEGVWETQDFRSASTRITIRFNGGVGNLTVR